MNNPYREGSVRWQAWEKGWQANVTIVESLQLGASLRKIDEYLVANPNIKLTWQNGLIEVGDWIIGGAGRLLEVLDWENVELAVARTVHDSKQAREKRT